MGDEFITVQYDGRSYEVPIDMTRGADAIFATLIALDSASNDPENTTTAALTHREVMLIFFSVNVATKFLPELLPYARELAGKLIATTGVQGFLPWSEDEINEALGG